MTAFFTADHHFGHTNIIKYTDRGQDLGVSTADEHDEELIRRWNNAVKPGDEVYHIGDFSLCHKKATAILPRLHGNIHLIEGNHDNVRGKMRRHLAWTKPYHRMKVEDTHVILFHYPIERWDMSHHGSWHLHGHSHGKCPSGSKLFRLDVGVDVHNYTPISFDHVKLIMSKKGNHDRNS